MLRLIKEIKEEHPVFCGCRHSFPVLFLHFEHNGNHDFNVISNHQHILSGWEFRFFDYKFCVHSTLMCQWICNVQSKNSRKSLFLQDKSPSVFDSFRYYSNGRMINRLKTNWSMDLHWILQWFLLYDISSI